MNFSGIGDQLNRFLYRKSVDRLTPSDLESARIWSLEMIRKNHPYWSEEQVQKYYHSLINVRIIAVDEWGRRMR